MGLAGLNNVISIHFWSHPASCECLKHSGVRQAFRYLVIIPLDTD